MGQNARRSGQQIPKPCVSIGEAGRSRHGALGILGQNVRRSEQEIKKPCVSIGGTGRSRGGTVRSLGPNAQLIKRNRPEPWTEPADFRGSLRRNCRLRIPGLLLIKILIKRRPDQGQTRIGRRARRLVPACSRILEGLVVLGRRCECLVPSPQRFAVGGSECFPDTVTAQA